MISKINSKPVGLLPLFLVSAAATGFETALTRYFALSKYSEYGYWVISIVMVGLALSGVVMALARDLALRHGQAILRALPLLMLIAGGVGYRFVTENPFNPLQLQNSVTWTAQAGNIGLYYLALLPFFFLVGLFISLSFMLNENRIGRVYAADLIGAGVGAALVLVLAFVVSPFRLVPAMLALVGLAALCVRRWRLILAAMVALVAVEAVLIFDDQATISETKAIYAPLHTQGSRILAEKFSPRGVYDLLDDFTERADVDVSNDAGLMNLPGPPRSLGLYRDGTRIVSIPRDNKLADYAAALLSALPYQLNPGARVLLIGSGGGFRVREARALGAARIDVLEPDPVIRGAILHGLGGNAPMLADPRVQVWDAGPLSLAHFAPGYDVIDLSSDFLDQAEPNQVAYTVESFARDYALLASGGVLSVPVSIRDFPAYGLRTMATLRAALLLAGVRDPAAHIAVYRSAWNARILVGRRAWNGVRLQQLRRFADDRSFDVVYYQGFDYAAARANIYNDLPPVSFASGEVDNSVSPDDALANEAAVLFAGGVPASAADFDLRPLTLDRPGYYSLLRLAHLGTVLRRLEILPQPEIAQLVNVAVLLQAGLFAFLVLCVPFFAKKRVETAKTSIFSRVVSFSALGLGFLFIEIALIDRAGLYLNDRTLAFAFVLTAMLVFSGLGSLLVERLPRYGLAFAAGLVVVWCVVAACGEQFLTLATQDWPLWGRLGLLLGVIAPVSTLMGMPFPLLLSRGHVAGSWFLPWAWGLNGAMSVVATPLANLMALLIGFKAVLLCAALLYGICIVADPTRSWLGEKKTL